MWPKNTLIPLIQELDPSDDAIDGENSISGSTSLSTYVLASAGDVVVGDVAPEIIRLYRF